MAGQSNNTLQEEVVNSTAGPPATQIECNIIHYATKAYIEREKEEEGTEIRD